MPPPPAWRPVWLVLGSPQELRAPRTRVPREVRWWGGAAGHALWFLSFTWAPAGSDPGTDEAETAQTELHVSPKYAGRFLLPLKCLQTWLNCGIICSGFGIGDILFSKKSRNLRVSW